MFVIPSSGSSTIAALTDVLQTTTKKKKEERKPSSLPFLFLFKCLSFPHLTCSASVDFVSFNLVIRIRMMFNRKRKFSWKGVKNKKKA
jgi:hypothetical protein